MHAVQILDPVDGETIYLRRNEYVEFCVPPKNKIKVQGRLLYLRDWYTDQGVAVYRVCHVDIKTDSRVFLGNIYIGMDGDLKCMPVYLRALREQEGLVVVDPRGDESEISSHEMIEVVINDPSVAIYPIIATAPGEVQLDHLRTESFSIPPEGKRSIFSLTRLLRGKDIEHHFWFRIRPAEVTQLKPGYQYSAGVINFMASEKKRLPYSLPVKIFTREWQHQIAQQRLLDSVYSGVDHIKMSGIELGLKRLIDPHLGVIINPNQKEMVDFVNGQDFMLVELPQPSYISHKLHKSAIWEAIVKQANWNNSERIAVEEISPRYVNYTKVQRFVVKNLLKSLAYLNGARLGDVIFRCGQHLHRNIEFWLVKERNPVEQQDDSNDGLGFTLEDLLPKVVEPERRTMRVCEVKFEEVKSKRLQDGEKVIPTFKPKLKPDVFSFNNGKLRVLK